MTAGSGELQLAPGHYRLSINGDENAWKPELVLGPGEVLRLEVSVRPRIVLLTTGAVLMVSGLGMTVASLALSMAKGSFLSPRLDTKSGVLLGVGLGTMMLGVVPMGLGERNRARVCRRGSTSGGAFEPCKARR